MVPSGSLRRASYTIAEYVSLEAYSNVRHEFLDGEIRAMAGGTPEHGAICANVIALLSGALHERRCRVHTSDVRIRIVASGLDTYPDVSVVCGRAENDAEDPLAIVNPILVAEVTSPSTEAYDRGEKLDHYQRIPSLRIVLLVSHAKNSVDVWQREDGGAWVSETFGRGDRMPLAALGCELRVDEVLRDPLA